MHPRLLAVLCASMMNGCGLIVHGTHQDITLTGVVPAGASVHANGATGTTPTIRVERSRQPLLVRVEYNGQSGCAIATSRMDRLVTTLDSLPAAIPLVVDAATGAVRVYPDTLPIVLQPSLPPDAEILADWRNGVANRCLPYPPILLSPGGVDRPYEILGSLTVSLDEAGRDAFAAYEQETTHKPRNETEELQAVLVYEARRRFGDRVNAIVNANPTFGPNSFSVWGLRSREGERSATGLAVHFTSTAEAAPVRDTAGSVSDRLRILRSLLDEKAITDEEYQRKRAEILREL